MSKVLTVEQRAKRDMIKAWVKPNDLEVPTPEGWHAEYSAEDDAIIYRHISEGMSREPSGFVYVLSRSTLAHFQGRQGAEKLRIMLDSAMTRSINRRA